MTCFESLGPPRGPTARTAGRLAVACGVLIAAAGAAADGARLLLVDPLYRVPYATLEPLDISADGLVVVGRSQPNPLTEMQAFLWTESAGIRGLGDFSAPPHSAATGVSANGKVIVGSGSRDGHAQAFRWTSAGGLVALADLGGGADSSGAAATNGDGTVTVGACSTSGGTPACRWMGPPGFLPGSLGDLPGGAYGAAAFGASRSGSVVAGTGTNSSGLAWAFRWTSATGPRAVPGLPDWAWSEGRGVSGDGVTVIGSARVDGGYPERHAFAWSGAKDPEILPKPAGFSSDAFDVAGDGSLVVGEVYPHGRAGTGDAAVLWDLDRAGVRRVRTLEDLLRAEGVALPPGIALLRASAVAFSGEWVVIAGSTTSFTKMFVATLPARILD